MTVQSEETLLSRWSRRKQQTAQENQTEEQVVELQQKDLAENEVSRASNTKSDIDTEQPVLSDPVLSDEDMPPIESLNEDSDYSGFMSSGVSDELRNLALRKLFKAPQFNIRDGLDEYDEDFTSFEKLGDILTCDMKHQLELEAKKKLEEEADKLSQEESEPTVESLSEDGQQDDSEPSGVEGNPEIPADNQQINHEKVEQQYE